jgi:aminomethyltransferase
MSEGIDDIEFVVRAIPARAGASEFRQSMAPHPLVHQELPHDPSFGVYNSRLRSLAYGNVETEDLYWRLRQQVIMAHTGELPTEIRGPDATTLLDRVFTRDVNRIRVGRCSYQIACTTGGGTLMDGVLMRLASDRFWYVQGDGEFRGWLRAWGEGLNVEITNPHIWVSQVQGPRSMDVLAAVADHGMPETFRYFDLAEIRIAGQPVVVSRTGFTNELGWEFYFGLDIDAAAVGQRIMEAGEPYGIHTTPAAVTNARRIEGGLLFSGTDFDETVTPYEAGMGGLVDLSKPEFLGKAALERADHRCRTWGMQCPESVARHGESLWRGGERAGRVLSSDWSPTLQCGVAIVRLRDPDLGPGATLEVEAKDGQVHEATLCELPMYDRNGDIPRGRTTEIPERPDSR